jgi:hypothetical protein
VKIHKDRKSSREKRIIEIRMIIEITNIRDKEVKEISIIIDVKNII